MDTSRVIVLLIHLGFVFPFSSTVFHRVYHYVNMKMSWADAQSYCRDKYKDLATFESMEDIQKLQRPSLTTPQAWIGLNDDPKSWKKTLGNATNSWRWSATGKPSSTGFSNWRYGEPDGFTKTKYCCAVSTNGKWLGRVCSKTKHFLCFDDSTTQGKTYTLIKNSVIWRKAQSYCRTNHKDLAMVENDLEQSDMMVHVLRSMWIGLYRHPWSWSDGNNSSFRKWKKDQPDQNVSDGNCVFETEDHLWYNAACSEEFVFICYEDVAEVKMQTVRMKIQSDADLSDPDISDYILQQLSAELQKHGESELKLRWKKKPEKEEDPEVSRDDCNI